MCVFGFLNINKPPGPTSHDVVATVRRLLRSRGVPRKGPRAVKVGHAGTLDPFAAGVLVACVGPATRLASRVQAQPKRYLAEVTLGATSTTDDVQGEISPSPSEPAQPPSQEEILGLLPSFVGEIQQAPPAHSAVHVDGRRAYALARQGEQVSLPARPVTVYSLELVRYAYPLLSLDVACGSGTYIRALARDIGAKLGIGGYCSGLTRTQVGSFGLDEAVAPEAIDLSRDLLSPLVALSGLARVTVEPVAIGRLRSGNAIALDSPAAPGETAVLDEGGRLVALGTVADDAATFRPRKVFQALGEA